jgi:NAD(P)-dependent dehydrogenase (short-subunit alcohol dehydrogenase family)
MSDPFAPYADAHVWDKLAGPGDARPTAIQICEDNDRVGNMTDMTVLVTGATSGIGVETARAFHHCGARVFFTARSMKKAEETIKDIRSTSAGKGDLIPIEMELESLASVRKGAEEFLKQSDKLNILVNNAGIMACPEAKTVDGFERQFGTNHLSHFLLFNLLKDTLLKSSTPEFNSRVVDLSSVGHKAGSVKLDNYQLEGIYEPWVSYGQAKTANIHMANYIDRVYGPKGLHALSVHPGGIWTGLQVHVQDMVATWKENPAIEKFMKSTAQGAATTLWCAIGKVWEGKGGRYCEDCREAPAAQDSEIMTPGYAAHAYDPEGEDKLWTLSEKLVGLA